MQDPGRLPEDLPRPVDDGAADHLPGLAIPPVALKSTDGDVVQFDHAIDPGRRLVLYAYPKTGRPGVALAPGWDDIPGARGCTPESCGFRDHAKELAAAGAAVMGVSTQDTDYQREAVERLRLPFPLLSDADGDLTKALRLPTFDVQGERLLKRLTLIIHKVDSSAVVEHVFYPVFPPDRHAEEVLAWLSDRTS
jgi:peroxiredoxin